VVLTVEVVMGTTEVVGTAVVGMEFGRTEVVWLPQKLEERLLKLLEGVVAALVVCWEATEDEAAADEAPEDEGVVVARVVARVEEVPATEEEAVLETAVEEVEGLLVPKTRMSLIWKKALTKAEGFWEM
jgi:CO dehydrogenase/acetyl-CoA synthase beta subunit